MYFSSIVCLIVVSNIDLSIGFPFFIRTFPKNAVRYNSIPAPIRTIPTFPLSNQLQRRRAQSQYSFNKVDNAFPDDQFIEQRKIDDRDDGPSDESSDLHPIYVLPPPNFQPIVYPSSRADSGLSASKVSPPGGWLLKPQLNYEIPKGLSPWIFGGLSTTQKTNYWDQLGKELAHHTPIREQQPQQVVIYLKRTDPKGHKSWPSIPIYEAHSVLKEQTNAINTIVNKNKNKTKITNNNNKGMKTKLPVGMTSFFLGGMRGISGRHWQMPATMVSQLEFMPNDNTVSTDKRYKPGVQFDDDNDFYNYNVIRDHK